MSEKEKKLRSDYKRLRKCWIARQTALLIAVLILATVATLLTVMLDKTYYITARETPSVDYGIHLKENAFYDEEYLGKDYAYIASLIDTVEVDFAYELATDAAEPLSLTCTYWVEAVLEIKIKSSGKVLYCPVDNLTEAKRLSGNGSGIRVAETVLIDYDQYNQLASDFVKSYQLSGVAESNLVLKMHANTVGKGDQLEGGVSKSDYVASLSVPLTTNTVEVKITSAAPAAERQIPSYSTKSMAAVFRVLSFVFGGLAPVLALVLLCFIRLTANADTTYRARVDRLVRSYKSFIQKIHNTLDLSGYQPLFVDTFEEMLEIRDTISAPILMSENADETCTHFLIPTPTRLLYVYELKVDDYDEIYGKQEEQEEKPTAEDESLLLEFVHDDVVDEVKLLDAEHVDLAELDAAVHQPTPELSEIDYVQECDPVFVETEQAPGVEVVGVVWPERPKRNKIYRYDPNGEQLEVGDTVLVPTRDVHRNKDVVRKAAVAQENHLVDPEALHKPLKKIIGVLRHKLQNTLEAQSSKQEKRKK